MKKITVTIGIPAHNEEKNIKKLLRSVLSQNSENYTLEKVIVALDGCTDKTLERVMEIKKTNKKIQILSDNKRLGKSARLNQLFSVSTSKILVLLDADIVLSNKKSLSEFILPFTKNNSIHLVGGCDNPMKGTGTIEKAVVSGAKTWNSIRHDKEALESIHNIHGSNYALSNKLYKTLNIPMCIFNDDEYIYLSNKKLKWGFYHSCMAKVTYSAPKTISDFLSQSSRFSEARIEIIKCFGAQSLNEFHVSKKSKIKYTANNFINTPLYTLIYIALELLKKVTIRQLNTNIRTSNYWETIKTTK